MIPEIFFKFASQQRHEISQKIRQTEQSQKKKSEGKAEKSV